MLDYIDIPSCESVSDQLSRIGDTSISRSPMTALDIEMVSVCPSHFVPHNHMKCQAK